MRKITQEKEEVDYLFPLRNKSFSFAKFFDHFHSTCSRRSLGPNHEEFKDPRIRFKLQITD